MANMERIAGKELRSTRHLRMAFLPGKFRREKRYAAGTATSRDRNTVAAASTTVFLNQVRISSPKSTSL